MLWLQDTAEIALRGAALLTRLLLDVLDSKAPPPGLLQAAASLHDSALLVSGLNAHADMPSLAHGGSR